MEKVSIAGVESSTFGDGVDCRRLTDLLGATDLAVNHYRIAPGEGFPSGLHAHGDQEEVFVVLDGVATFERLGPQGDDPREVTVREGEAVRFAPGEYQSGRNGVSESRSDGSEDEQSASSGDDLVALALGAPRDSEDLRVPLACPECGHDYLRPETGGEGVILACPACEAGNVPEGCPECGREMRVTLGESGDGQGAGAETVVVCPDCGAETASPFGG